jgi:hypothetical protein
MTKKSRNDCCCWESARVWGAPANTVHVRAYTWFKSYKKRINAVNIRLARTNVWSYGSGYSGNFSYRTALGCFASN